MEEDPKISFQKAGYKLIRQLIDPDTLSSIFTHLIEQGKGQRHTGFYKGVFFYKHPIFEQLLVSMLPTIEEHTAYSLYKTYSFARQYLMGDELKPHTDRNACEITVSISLSVENNCWPIWLSDYNNQELSFSLLPGDALIFKGIELRHWRLPNTFGACKLVFLHYVDQNGPYASCRDDCNK